MISDIRKILWHIGIINCCPLCGQDLMEVGYPEDDIWQNYKCSSQKCSFGKYKKTK